MKKLLIATAVAALATASQANAATLVYAQVSGTTNATRWDAGQNSAFSDYTLFLSRPQFTLLNTGTDATHWKGLSSTVTTGENSYGLAGNYASNVAPNGDTPYRLTLRFDDGTTLTGLFNTEAPGATGFTGSSATGTDGTLYTLTGFTWNGASGGNVVGPYSPNPDQTAPDYTGTFRFTATAAVPEPATWAMMLVGFGMVGAAARRRRSAAKVTYA